MLAEREDLVVRFVLCHQLDLGNALRELQRGLQGVRESTFDVVPADQPVDDHLDGVLFVPRELRARLQEFVDVVHLAVDAGADKTLTGDVPQECVVLTLPRPDHRGEHLETSPLGQGHDAVDDLLRRLALQPGPVVRAVLHPDARVEETQVVVHLGDRPDRRTWVA